MYGMTVWRVVGAIYFFYCMYVCVARGGVVSFFISYCFYWERPVRRWWMVDTKARVLTRLDWRCVGRPYFRACGVSVLCDVIFSVRTMMCGLAVCVCVLFCLALVLWERPRRRWGGHQVFFAIMLTGLIGVTLCRPVLRGSLIAA